LFIKIQFEKSNFTSYVNDKDYLNFIENKTIPEELRFNIFTEEQVKKLDSVLDTNLKTERVNTFCLSKTDLYKNVPYTWLNSSEEEKQKAKDYEEKYDNEGEFLNIYLIKNTDNVYVVDSDILFSLLDSFNIKYKYTVVGTIKDLPSAKYTSELKVIEKLLSLEEKLNIFSKEQQFNTNVGVHISDLGLLNVKEVDVLYDPCTDELQTWLNEGWRILAICPQPDKRRPDYILGRNERLVDRKRREKTCDK
jgi:hypothetical protein